MRLIRESSSLERGRHSSLIVLIKTRVINGRLEVVSRLAEEPVSGSCFSLMTARTLCVRTYLTDFTLLQIRAVN